MELEQKFELERYLIHLGEKYFKHDQMVEFADSKAPKMKSKLGAIPRDTSRVHKYE